jgi:ribose 5-phosphate isomerase B
MNLDENIIREMVRAALLKELGAETSSTPIRPLITEADITALPPGSSLPVPAQAIITPLARQTALLRRIQFVGQDDPIPSLPGPEIPQPQIVAFGADHGGYALKQVLKDFVQAAGYGVLDLGTHNRDSVDYPDFAHAVALTVAEKRAWRGILIDGAGIGSAMAANKVPGIRAALCYDQATALNSREHNDANVLTLGAGLIGEALAKQIAEVWLKTPFGGGRHARRVNKIMQIERHYLKK